MPGLSPRGSVPFPSQSMQRASQVCCVPGALHLLTAVRVSLKYYLKYYSWHREWTGTERIRSTSDLELQTVIFSVFSSIGVSMERAIVIRYAEKTLVEQLQNTQWLKGRYVKALKVRSQASARGSSAGFTLSAFPFCTSTCPCAGRGCWGRRLRSERRAASPPASAARGPGRSGTWCCRSSWAAAGQRSWCRCPCRLY